MPSFYFQGKEVYYEVYGEGSPLIIANGIMMSTRSWSKFVANFSQFHQLILLDFFDQGQSASLDEDYDLDLQAQLIFALYNHLKLEKIKLFGISYGGLVALTYAVNYPETIDKLLLFNSSAYTDAWFKELGLAWQKAAHDPEAFYATTIPLIYSSEYYEQNQARMNERKASLLALFADPVFIARQGRLIRSANNYDLRDSLASLNCACLIVGSTADSLTPVAGQRLMHQLLPNSSLLILEGLGHATMYENPSLFASLVLGFTLSQQEDFSL